MQLIMKQGDLIMKTCWYHGNTMGIFRGITNYNIHQQIYQTGLARMVQDGNLMIIFPICSRHRYWHLSLGSWVIDPSMTVSQFKAENEPFNNVVPQFGIAKLVEYPLANIEKAIENCHL